MTENRGFAVIDKSRIQKAKKIISCIEFVMGEKLINKTILEIGAGSGLISYEISKYGNEVTTIDVQDASIKETIIRYNIQFNNFSFLIASGIKLPFKPNSFDVVVCNQVIEHTPKRQHRRLIDESYSVLKTNGIFYIATPNKLWPIEPHYKLPFLSWLPSTVANWYVRMFGGTENYDVSLPTYWELDHLLVSIFKGVNNITVEVIRNPKKFNADDVVPAYTKVISDTVLRKLVPYLPGWIYVVKK